MREKLILEERLHCPFCWADVTGQKLQNKRIPQGFFTKDIYFIACPSCGTEIGALELVLITEPSKELWARRHII